MHLNEKTITMQTIEKMLPVGIQSFEVIRRDNYKYVDKTDIVWQLVNTGSKFNYFSRPRRFGKSLIVDTLHCYLNGKKELFEGLKIMQFEKEWNSYPVVRLDMSLCGDNVSELKAYFSSVFRNYEAKYGITIDVDDSLANRFGNIILAASKQTNMPVAILIDEYDSPLQHSWNTSEHEGCTALYRSVFAVLKAYDRYEKFIFITGITKFTQISLFSVLNNLSNISFNPQCVALCGITEKEISDNFKPEMQRLAARNGWTIEEAHQRLKAYYDGYHFSEDNMTDIYNPYSLVNAFANNKILNFWASSGATSLLPKFINDLDFQLENLEKCYVDRDTLCTSDVTGGGVELFLFQSGYLTIKGFNEGVYVLGFPNTEVRQALYRVVVPSLVMRSTSEVLSTQNRLMASMNSGDVPEAMKCLKALIADVPYSNKKMQSMDMEERYRLIISTILNAVGYSVEVERMLSGGRIDIVARTLRYIYIMELKLVKNGGVASAEAQIIGNGYAEPFKADGRTPICLAIELDNIGKGLINWKKVEV